MLKHFVKKVPLHPIKNPLAPLSTSNNNISLYSFSTISASLIKTPTPSQQQHPTKPVILREFEKNPEKLITSIYCYNALSKLFLDKQKQNITNISRNDVLWNKHQQQAVIGDSLSQWNSNFNPIFQAPRRNSRKPKKANHGARPCSRFARKKRKRQYGNPKRCRG